LLHRSSINNQCELQNQEVDEEQEEVGGDDASHFTGLTRFQESGFLANFEDLSAEGLAQ
jgi:hypothetical protein